MERHNVQRKGISIIKEYEKNTKARKPVQTNTNQPTTQVSYKPLPSEPLKSNHKAKIYKEKRTPVIDLHGLTRKEVMESCDRFLNENSGQRVEIIAGKGINYPPMSCPETRSERDIERKRNTSWGT